KAADILKTIPSLLFIGISGSLAVKNVKREDDIDFFIISQGKYIWLTRLQCILLLSKHAVRRTRTDIHEKDKICLNMFVSDTSLSFKKATQDLYLAHEIAQLEPIFSRNNTYQKFISQNGWVRSFLPNMKE